MYHNKEGDYMTYNVKILDSNRKHVGALMTASVQDIINLIDKGMIVVNVMDNTEFTKESLMNTVGVSDGLIGL
jgi:hypothetical protein